MKPTTNVEFIATYIFHHPGARHLDIMKELRKWRRIEEKYCTSKLINDTLIPLITQNTWGRQYFSRYATHSNRYLDTHWRAVESGKPRSGYVLTALGLSKVRTVIIPHRNGSCATWNGPTSRYWPYHSC